MLTHGVGPLQVAHLGQLTSVTFSFDVRPGIALSQASVIAISNVCEQLVVLMALPRVMALPPDLSRARNLALFALVLSLVLGLLGRVEQRGGLEIRVPEILQVDRL